MVPSYPDCEWLDLGLNVIQIGGYIQKLIRWRIVVFSTSSKSKVSLLPEDAAEDKESRQSTLTVIMNVKHKTGTRREVIRKSASFQSVLL